MMTDPATDGWKGTGLLDESQSLPKLALGSKVNISLDIDVRRAIRLARRGVLLFRPRFALHCVAARTLVIVVENDAGIRIRGYGILWAGHDARGIFTVMAI
jgi:hypothetical protein